MQAVTRPLPSSLDNDQGFGCQRIQQEQGLIVTNFLGRLQGPAAYKHREPAQKEPFRFESKPQLQSIEARMDW